MDFAVLPPEVNSARMYAGSGSAPMLAAAAAWDRLAATLTSTVSSYRTVLEELTDGGWQGPSASAMFAAAQPYLSWLGSTAGQAAVTAGRARTVAALYEAAYAATVPPAVVAANRAQLANLTQSNVLGQNTAAIAANQADYAQMWATDATAMQTYAAGSAAAAPDLSALTAAPQTTSATAGGPAAASAAVAAQSAAGQGGLLGSIASWLNNVDGNNPIVNFMNSDPVTAFETIFPVLDALYGGVQDQVLFAGLSEIAGGLGVVAAISGAQTFAGVTGAVPAFAASAVSEGAQKFTLAGAQTPIGGGTVSASLGRATPIGGFSAPASWHAAAPATALAAASSPLPAGTPGGLGAPCFGGIPPAGGLVNASRTGGPGVRSESTLRVIPRLARAGGGIEGGGRHPAPASVDDLDDGEELSEYEQRELDTLRDTIAELTAKRDAASRSIREAIQYQP